jgi:hypothetical protein
MWSRGRHFQIASRDVGKSTADSYISAYFDIGMPEKQEFVGQIEQIMKLDYDTVEPILIRAKWFKNNAIHGRPSTTLVEDECGIQRVLTTAFMRNDLFRHEPYVFPEQCNQVFLVPDKVHLDWQLVVDTEVRRERPNLPHLPHEVTASGPGTSHSGEDDDFDDPSVESDSEGEPGIDEALGNNDEDMYLEEIITYKRRRKQPIVVENHTLEGSVEDDVLSDEENLPDIPDFPEIET